MPADNKTRPQAALTRWLQGNEPRWRELARRLRAYRERKTHSPADMMALAQGHRLLARDLSMARSVAADSTLSRYLERLFVRMHAVIYRKPYSLRHGLRQLYMEAVPRVCKKMMPQIYAVAALFILSAMAGWWIVSRYPELAALFASEGMINGVGRGELWTDDLLNIMPSSALALSIMTNNIMVSLFAFALGALYGLGTIYIIALNGLMLGGVFAFTAHHGLGHRLLEFVVAHGVVELSVICLAGAAGVQLGESLMRPGGLSRSEAFAAAVADAGKLLAVVIPFLVGAGVIEGYISPNPDYPFAARVVIGVGYGVLLWGFLTGAIWRKRGRG